MDVAPLPLQVLAPCPRASELAHFRTASLRLHDDQKIPVLRLSSV